MLSTSIINVQSQVYSRRLSFRSPVVVHISAVYVSIGESMSVFLLSYPSIGDTRGVLVLAGCDD
jgi:hypothetical protein